jgi:penicillin-binding protein 1A
VTLTQALANSLNTVAVRLTLECGVDAVIRTAYRLGITSRLDANASIALGTSVVSPFELVAAYATFANGGFAISPHVVERITTADGKTLYDRSAQPLGRVVDARYIAMMNTMMQQTLISGTARAASLPGWQAAGKTGTTEDYRDAWFIGYTSHLVAGIWLGNDDNSPTKRAVGGGLPVEIWSRFMKVAHARIAPAPLPGLADGSRFDAAPPPAAPAPAVAANDGGQQNNRQNGGSGLDSWLLDKLFGRR